METENKWLECFRNKVKVARVKKMSNDGMSVEEIVKTVGMEESEVRTILNEDK